MSNRSRLVVGSIVGAVAIHLVMLACSGGGESARDASVSNTDGGVFDVVADVIGSMRDAMKVITDSELRDAHADDAGTCSCPTFNRGFTLTSYDRGSGAEGIRDDYSTASIGATPFLHAGQPQIELLGGASFYLVSGEQVQIACHAFVRPTRELVSDVAPTCSIQGGPSFNNPAVEVTVLTDTDVEFRVPTLTDRAPDGGALRVSITGLTFRAHNSAGGFVTPPRALYH